MEELLNELFETSEGDLMKIHKKYRMSIDKGSNLGIGIARPNQTNLYIQLSTDEINRFAFWLNKNFDLELCPGFKEAKEHEDLKLLAENRKKANDDAVVRMNELARMIRRFTSICGGVLEAERLKGEFLSTEARLQIKEIMEEAMKIHD
jgi:hypothetical protein